MQGLRRVAAVGMGLAALAAVTAGCSSGETSATYVSNNGEGVFLRLPRTWETFTTSSADPSGLDGATAGNWSVAFDSSPDPSRGNIESALPESPVGTLDIVPFWMLSESGRLSATHESLRRMFLPGREIDPLNPTDLPEGVEPADADFEVLNYAELEFGTHWGIELTATVSDASGASITLTHVAAVTDDGDRLVVLRLRCTTECYESHQGEIDDVLQSFTLEER